MQARQDPQATGGGQRLNAFRRCVRETCVVEQPVGVVVLAAVRHAYTMIAESLLSYTNGPHIRCVTPMRDGQASCYPTSRR